MKVKRFVIPPKTPPAPRADRTKPPCATCMRTRSLLRRVFRR